MIESSQLYEALLREAQFGQHRVLNTRHGTEQVLRDDALTLEQPDASVYLNEEGSVRVMIRAWDSEACGMASLTVIIHENIEERLWAIDTWAVLGRRSLDRSPRCIVAAVQGGGHVGWRTRAEHAQSRTHCR
jgi:hypothetical protein